PMKLSRTVGLAVAVSLPSFLPPPTRCCAMMAAAAVARALIDGDDAEQLAQLCQTSKAEAIGAIATEIIHDFNNLLTPMITIMDQIQRDCDHTSVRNARRIESAIACAERAQQLVHRI